MFDHLVTKYSRRWARASGMSAEDLAQELRLRLLEAKITDEGYATIAIYNRCVDFARARKSRDEALPTEAQDTRYESPHDAPHAGLTPEEEVMLEAEDATLARLAPDIDSARAAHRPLNTVRPGLTRADWIARLIRKDRSFNGRLIESGVRAMQELPTEDPIAIRNARAAWRYEAFRRSAGALGEHTGVLARRPVDVEKVSASRPNYGGFSVVVIRRLADWPSPVSSITPRADHKAQENFVTGPATLAEEAEIDAYLKRVPTSRKTP